MINERFEANQKNTTLPPIKVIWAGASVMVHTYNEKSNTIGLCLTTIDARNVVKTLKSYCVKNDCRCPQIQGNRVML